MSKVIIWDPLERMLLGIAIGILFMTGVFFLIKMGKQEEHQGKRMMLGFGLFYILFAIRNIFIFMSDFYYLGTFRYGAFFGQIDQYYPLHEIYLSLAHTFVSLSFISLLFGLESYYKKSRFIFTMIESSVIIIIIIAPFELEQILISPYTPYVAIVCIIIIYDMVKKSSSELKAIGFFFFNSFACIMLGIIITYPDFKTMNVMPLFSGSLFFLLACVFIFLPLALNVEKLTKTMNYYLFSIIIGGTVSFLAVIINIFSNFNLISKLFTVFTVFFIIFFYVKTYPLIKAQITYSGNEDILKVFIKTSRVTEEEVTVSKEKRTCLICKNKLQGRIFICGSCGAYYCNKCSKALENAENICWVCETPLDGSRPQRAIQEDKSDADIEKEISSIHKKIIK